MKHKTPLRLLLQLMDICFVLVAVAQAGRAVSAAVQLSMQPMVILGASTLGDAC